MRPRHDLACAAAGSQLPLGVALALFTLIILRGALIAARTSGSHARGGSMKHYRNSTTMRWVMPQESGVAKWTRDLPLACLASVVRH